MQRRSRALASRGKKLGLVPTMGFLHEGHLSLVRRAKKSCDVVIVSIFVNPAQFAPSEDLSRYPRDEKSDLAKLKKAGADIIFIPRAADIYPDNFQTYINVEGLTASLEGAVRPTHFRGVTTIVAKLFNITRPDLAIFGMKDYQQAMVLKQMTRDLNYPLKFIIAPTVREKDGLAMSSRNSYFTPGQRLEAVCLYHALLKARSLVKENVKDANALRAQMEKVILQICPSAAIDYIAFTDFESLQPLDTVQKNCICSLAVKVHNVRLIDNMKLL
jgi:pantoate--beta-alanine ligase